MLHGTAGLKNLPGASRQKNVILNNCAEKTWSNWAEIGLLGTVRADVLKGVP
jgi:hypothetical protein